MVIVIVIEDDNRDANAENLRLLDDLIMLLVQKMDDHYDLCKCKCEKDWMTMMT